MSSPFRVVSLRTEAVPGDGGALKPYLDRLLKMIPAEVVSLYLVGIGFVPKEQVVAGLAWLGLCLIGVIVVRVWGTSDPEAELGPQWPAVGIACVAFLIWTYSMGGPYVAAELHVPWLGSLLVLAWTFFVPYVYHGD